MVNNEADLTFINDVDYWDGALTDQMLVERLDRWDHPVLLTGAHGWRELLSCAAGIALTLVLWVALFEVGGSTEAPLFWVLAVTIMDAVTLITVLVSIGVVRDLQLCAMNRRIFRAVARRRGWLFTDPPSEPDHLREP